MHTDIGDSHPVHEITLTDEVRSFVRERKCDFRICTSCGGPILLPTTVKPPKSSDMEIYVDDQIIYVSVFQARYIDHIHMGMIPRFFGYE
ncbi:MAG: hypothetical protein APR53_05080 [Methanoculleus sp. SDB]|nr:MAG: hypothetical protein APR53_05080 [Methanoculleus sp. SDB]